MSESEDNSLDHVPFISFRFVTETIISTDHRRPASLRNTEAASGPPDELYMLPYTIRMQSG